MGQNNSYQKGKITPAKRINSGGSTATSAQNTDHGALTHSAGVQQSYGTASMASSVFAAPDTKKPASGDTKAIASPQATHSPSPGNKCT